MLLQEKPDDFVVATGKSHTVREFCDLAFKHVGLNYEDHVVVDPKFYRPAEEHQLLGDPAKAKKKLDWQPEYRFEDMVTEMVDADLAYLSK
jgi:GDPmannose 4,6-dehydratase